MILAGQEMQVLVAAAKPVDFRNYAARTIMQSARRSISDRACYQQLNERARLPGSA